MRSLGGLDGILEGVGMVCSSNFILLLLGYPLNCLDWSRSPWLLDCFLPDF